MKKIITYDGIFHPSGILAIALLKHYSKDEFSIVRTKDPKVISKADIAVDVGGVFYPPYGLFDYHQESYKGPLTSAGMVAGWLINQGLYIIPIELKKLINLVDRDERGEIQSEDTFIETIKSLNHCDIHSPTQDDRFNLAVKYAVLVIKGVTVNGADKTRVRGIYRGGRHDDLLRNSGRRDSFLQGRPFHPCR